MKGAIFITLFGASLLLLTAFDPLNLFKSKEITQEYHPTYKNGQILYPDMVHNDTLVVVDANELNRIFKYNKPETDQDIWEALHTSCAVFGESQIPIRDYQLEVFMDTIWLYDKHRLVGQFMWEDSSDLGRILTKDNE